MRILHISTNYKPAGSDIGYGGVERHVAQLAMLQQERGKYVNIITTDEATGPTAIRLFPRDLYTLAFTDRERYDRELQRLLAQVLEMCAGYDVVHDHMGAFTLFSGRLNRLPPNSFLSCYAQPRHYAYEKLFRECAEIFAGKSVRPTVVASSHTQRTSLQQLLDVDYVVYPVVADNIGYLECSGLISVYIGGIRPDKCQLELANFAKRHDIPILFVGPVLAFDEESRRYGDAFIRTMDISIDRLKAGEVVGLVSDALRRGSTIWVGELFDRKLVEEIFAVASSIVLLNRTEEVFSTVAMEAMKRGIPCILGPYDSAWESSMGMASIVGGLEDDDLLSAFSRPPASRRDIKMFADLLFDSRRWELQWEVLYRSR